MEGCHLKEQAPACKCCRLYKLKLSHHSNTSVGDRAILPDESLSNGLGMKHFTSNGNSTPSDAIGEAP